MKESKTIGSLIKAEVEKQGLSAVEFAERICCERQNVYRIFGRTHIDSVQLAQISRVLDHNFFVDIASDMALSGVDDKEACQEVYNRTAIAQFCEVVPKVLYKMGVDSFITLGRPLDLSLEIPIPEYTINPFYLTFSTNQLLADNPNCGIASTAVIEKYTDSETGIVIDRWIFKHSGFVLYNMLLDYKTEQEWEQTLKFFLTRVYRTSVL